jgi:hypothetical protein
MNAVAQVRTSVEMEKQGIITKAQATPVASGLPASPGAASGIAVFDADRADTQEERQEALDRLLPLQQKDFKALFEVMSPFPVVIRALLVSERR